MMMMMMLLMELESFCVFTQQQRSQEAFDSSGCCCCRENFAINQPEIRERHFVTVELIRHAMEQSGIEKSLLKT